MQQHDFTGLRYARGITPTDIDGLIEYGEICFLFYEFKHESNPEMPGGQRMAIERLCDAIGKPSIALLATHDTPADADVPADKAKVVRYFWRGKWRDTKRPVTVKEFSDWFIDMAVKSDALDQLFSRLIRERANWTCEKCERDFHHDPHSLQCAHIVGRRVMLLRHDPRNAVALCASCHFYFTDRPLEFSGWIRSHIGDVIADELQRLSQVVHKRHKHWKKDARAHYRIELAKMERKRAEGDEGYLEFVGFW